MMNASFSNNIRYSVYANQNKEWKKILNGVSVSVKSREVVAFGIFRGWKNTIVEYSCWKSYRWKN